STSRTRSGIKMIRGSRSPRPRSLKPALSRAKPSGGFSRALRLSVATQPTAFRRWLFSEDRVEVLHGLIRDHSLAALVTLGSGGLVANHIPLIVDPEPAPFGTLRGHMARGNGQWKESRADTMA